MRIDSLLVEKSLARSRGHAADLIQAGRVFIGLKQVKKPAQAVELDAEIKVLPADEYVSRAGIKLAHALDKFRDLEVVGKTALDVGASTGGFTDVLLRRGADRVVAIDVGHDQMDENLKNNPRVFSIESLNAREVTLDLLERETGLTNLSFSIAVADLSFISLTLVIDQLSKLAPNADFVFLIKPQFEVGKQSLSASGIVSDHRLRSFAIKQVIDSCFESRLGVKGLEKSDLPGTHGNIEYLLWVSGAEPVNRSKWNRVIDELVREGR